MRDLDLVHVPSGQLERKRGREVGHQELRDILHLELEDLVYTRLDNSQLSRNIFHEFVVI